MRSQKQNIITTKIKWEIIKKKHPHTLIIAETAVRIVSFFEASCCEALLLSLYNPVMFVSFY